MKKRAEFAEKFKSTTAEQEEQMLQSNVKKEEEKKAKLKNIGSGKKMSGGVKIFLPQFFFNGKRWVRG